jgi:hypothetical protein
MLTRNVYVEGGIVNGTMGWMLDVGWLGGEPPDTRAATMRIPDVLLCLVPAASVGMETFCVAPDGFKVICVTPLSTAASVDKYEATGRPVAALGRGGGLACGQLSQSPSTNAKGKPSIGRSHTGRRLRPCLAQITSRCRVQCRWRRLRSVRRERISVFGGYSVLAMTASMMPTESRLGSPRSERGWVKLMPSLMQRGGAGLPTTTKGVTTRNGLLGVWPRSSVYRRAPRPWRSKRRSAFWSRHLTRQPRFGHHHPRGRHGRRCQLESSGRSLQTVGLH